MQIVAIRKSILSAQALAGLSALGAVWMVLGIVLALVLGGAVGAGIPVLELTRDPSAVTGAPFYTGAISHLGVLLWAGAATVAFFCFALLRHLEVQPDAQRFFLGSGLLTTLLLVDDLFLLHESVFPFHLGVAEEAVLLGYASLALAYLFRFRGFIAQTNHVILALAAAWFGTSVVVDMAGSQGMGMMVAEDLAKLFGIATWATYFVVCGIDRLGRLRSKSLA